MGPVGVKSPLEMPMIRVSFYKEDEKRFTASKRRETERITGVRG